MTFNQVVRGSSPRWLTEKKNHECDSFFVNLTPEELDRLIEEEKEKIKNSELVKKIASTPQ